MEAAVACHVKGEEVLLVACDVPYPEPLHALRPIADTLAVAMVLAPRVRPGTGGERATRTGPWALRLSVLPQPAAATPCGDAALEALRTQIPAARALPLLAALAAAAGPAGAADWVEAATFHLDAADGCTLAVQVQAEPRRP
jgi:hypothetical protein